MSQKSLGLRSGVNEVGTRVEGIIGKPHRRYERVCKSAETAKVFARTAQVTEPGVEATQGTGLIAYISDREVPGEVFR